MWVKGLLLTRDMPKLWGRVKPGLNSKNDDRFLLQKLSQFDIAFIFFLTDIFRHLKIYIYNFPK